MNVVDLYLGLSSVAECDLTSELLTQRSPRLVMDEVMHVEARFYNSL